MSLEKRLERLERQNRRFKQGIVLAVVLAASALLAGAAGRLPRNIATASTHHRGFAGKKGSRRYQGGEGRSAVHILAGFRRNIPQHAVRISKRRRINRLSRPEREGPPLDGRVSGLAANQLYQRRGKTYPDHPVRGTERSPPRGKWLKTFDLRDDFLPENFQRLNLVHVRQDEDCLLNAERCEIPAVGDDIPRGLLAGSDMRDSQRCALDLLVRPSELVAIALQHIELALYLAGTEEFEQVARVAILCDKPERFFLARPADQYRRVGDARGAAGR